MNKADRDARAQIPPAVHLAAGAVSGALQTIAWHPLDLLKTRMQVQDARLGRLPVYTSLLDAVRTIMRSESWRGFFHGLAPNVCGSALAWGLQMPLYSRLKRLAADTAEGGDAAQPHPWRDLACSLCAGCITNLFVHPIFLVKTRMQLQVLPKRAALDGGVGAGPTASYVAVEASGDVAYQSSLHAVRCIVRDEGLGGLYRGFAPSMLLVSHGAILLMSYDQLRVVCPSVLTASFLAKMFATMVTYPSQVMRAVMQQRPQAGARGVPYSSMLITAQTLWRQGGVRAFYRGIYAQMLRTVPQSMAFFSIYEFMLKQIGAMHDYVR